MRTLAILFAAALVCAAQTTVKRGEQVFAKTCATGYCHGPHGASSGAPRLAGRGFTQGYIAGSVMRGVPGSGMPAFGMTLSKDDLTAVIAYVGSLNGISVADTAETAASSEPALKGEAARGAKLFTEATRGFGRCSTCHQVGRFGISVASPIGQVPTSVAALKTLATPNVKTAMLDGESMPALVLRDSKQGTLFYDLTSVPPVERNVPSGAVKFADGSSWRHSTVIGLYSDAELEAILAYLRASI